MTMLTKVKRSFRASQCKPQLLEWLNPGRIPAGKLMLIDGDPNLGKSLVTLDIAARLTTGRPLFDGPHWRQPASVVLVGSEDGIQDTVLPRLTAAGADLDRVTFFTGKSVNGGSDCPPVFPDDCDLLLEILHETNAVMAVIDPLMAYLRAVNGPAIRDALDGLSKVADKTRAVIPMVRHLNKGGRGQQAIFRGKGSIDIIGAARIGFLVGPHPTDEDVRLFACNKLNLGTPPPTLGFRIVPNKDGVPVVSWMGEMDISANDITLAPVRVDGQAVRNARDFLAKLLRRGTISAEEAKRRCLEAGISRRTLDRAKRELPIDSVLTNTDTGQRWYWTLTTKDGDALSAPERRKRAIAEAQRQSDEHMARLCEQYGGEVASSQ
jgi:hypothetical protein